MLQQKMLRSVELTDCRDSICPNASKRHHYRLDDYMESEEVFSGGLCSDLDGVTNLIEAGFDYMRLLELDNVADENRYKIASARLLSPLHDSDLVAVDSNAVVGNVSQRIGPPENGNHFVLSTANVVESSTTESNLDSAPRGTLSFVSSSGNQHGYPLGAPAEFCVISSDITDIESISNIFKATRSCMVQASLPSQSGHPVPSISILSSMEEKLPVKEKMCVFFSVLLLKLSHAWPGSACCGMNRAMLNCMDSFKELLITVMADHKMRSLFQEDSQVEYLLHIIEDFLMDGRVALWHGTCCTPEVSSIRDLGTAWNGNDGLFPPKTASTDLLLGGGVVLASICAATNNMGFLCEASYRIFQMHGSDTSLLLTILHAFSYICGKHYFTFPSYGTLMMVLKSLVSYTEDSLMSASSGSCPMVLDDGSDIRLSSCTGCPFRLKAVSMDEIAVLLMEKVVEAIHLSVVQYNEAGLWSLKSGRLHYEGIDRNNARVCSSPISQCGKSVIQSEKNLGDDLNHSIELLSLLELIANVVGWEFTHNKIIPSLLSVFSSCISVPIGAGVMVLIGQLGRIGVVTHGYDDVRVDALRNKLCEVVRQVTASASDTSFTVQTAVLNALLSLLPIDFVNIVGEDHGGTLASASSQSQSLAASSIRKWYSSLSRERQVLADGILQ
ncbi:hypothetical protein MLD38_039257 [Melastoma candidum]|uniref:Uncharacterized protein n=1 Tax=Melastoma candidum TaxID=119954 RepID=A0ACB9L1I8_9MYRT|nr:hypothetical protein MLD38_039257 [Melastoma candidum]